MTATYEAVKVAGLAWDTLALERLIEAASMASAIVSELPMEEEVCAAMHQLADAARQVFFSLPCLEAALLDGPLNCTDPRGFCFEEAKTEHICGCPAALAGRVAAFIASSRYKT